MGRKKDPEWVRFDGVHGLLYCEHCGAKYTVTMPAPLRVVAAVLKAYTAEHASCPPPAAGAKPAEPPQTPEQWLAGTDTGTSSRVIWAVMMKRHLPELSWDMNYPHDPDDFGRCHRLLKLFPEWRAHMDEVRGQGAVWRALVASWDAMEKLYEEELPSQAAPKLYALMRQIIVKGRGHG